MSEQLPPRLAAKVNKRMRYVSGESRYVLQFRQIVIDDVIKTDDWIRRLRDNGVKAAHPDDGWVNRTAHTVKLVYPDFDDGIRVGDVIALGRCESFRLVRITADIGDAFAFVDA